MREKLIDTTPIVDVEMLKTSTSEPVPRSGMTSSPTFTPSSPTSTFFSSTQPQPQSSRYHSPITQVTIYHLARLAKLADTRVAWVESSLSALIEKVITTVLVLIYDEAKKQRELIEE